MSEGAKLPDVQNDEVECNIPVWAGVSNVSRMHSFSCAGGRIRLPTDFCVSGRLSMRRGAHMSRFISAIDDTVIAEGGDSPILEKVALRVLEEDSGISKVAVGLTTDYPVQSPGGGLPECYRVDADIWVTRLSDFPGFRMKKHFSVTVPIMTVCPCAKAVSMSMSGGTASHSHSQRAFVSCKAWASYRYDASASVADVPFEEVILPILRCGSGALTSFLKRDDEATLVMEAYERPMFVEDVAREAHTIVGNVVTKYWFSKYVEHYDYAVSVTSMESIHRHNATASTIEIFG